MMMHMKRYLDTADQAANGPGLQPHTKDFLSVITQTHLYSTSLAPVWTWSWYIVTDMEMEVDQ